MLKLSHALLAVVGGIALTSATAVAQDSGPLIDILVKKGLINDQEAEELRTDLTKDFAGTSAGKLNLGSQITEFKLGGDVRLRHQYQETRNQNTTLTTDRTRERFRFRLNGDVQMQKGWSAGFALETASAADSGNQTFENGGDDYSIYLARAYIGWQPRNDLKFVAGKIKNPIYTTDLVWDGDINPQGVSETYIVSLGGKDSIEFRALQSIMDDNNEATKGRTGNDAWLFAQQAVFTKYFGTTKLIAAPGYMAYSTSNMSGLTNETPFNGDTIGLSLATFAGEVEFANIGAEGNSLKVYWDSSYNFEAGTRVHKVYGLSSATWNKDPLAWLLGVGYSHGSGKLQGDWNVRLDYRRIGVGSIDPNLSDSDFAFGNLNQDGFKLGASYNLVDFCSLNVTYFRTSDIRDTLKHAVAGLDKSSILQVDLVTKF
ncbi:MAG TPA: putative porin [Opitutaceae bacterium]|nr:putative porin [Opitutaceae bacterium]